MLFVMSLDLFEKANVLPREMYLVFLNGCTWYGKSNVTASVRLNTMLSARNK